MAVNRRVDKAIAMLISGLLSPRSLDAAQRNQGLFKRKI